MAGSAVPVTGISEDLGVSLFRLGMFRLRMVRLGMVQLEAQSRFVALTRLC